MEDQEAIAVESKAIYEMLLKREQAITADLFERPEPRRPETKRIVVILRLAPIFFVLLAIIFFAWLFYRSEILKFALLLILLIGYISLIALSLLAMYADRADLKQMFKNPLVMLFEGLIARALEDSRTRATLKNFNVESLQLARDRLDAQQNAITNRIGILVGPLDKVGVIPGFISLYAAFVTKEFSTSTVSIAVGIFFIYSLAFSIYLVLPRLSFYLRMLDSEIARKKGGAESSAKIG